MLNILQFPTEYDSFCRNFRKDIFLSSGLRGTPKYLFKWLSCSEMFTPSDRVKLCDIYIYTYVLYKTVLNWIRSGFLRA